jgi:hypothetical protein
MAEELCNGRIVRLYTLCNGDSRGFALSYLRDMPRPYWASSTSAAAYIEKCMASCWDNLLVCMHHAILVSTLSE